MGSKSKGTGVLGGALSGAAMGSSLGMPGILGGAALGALGGSMDTDGAAPQQVRQVDPAFMNSLYNQAMGTEATAADMKMKAAFDKTLAQQVSAARAQRGVNPALLQRNVSRLAAEAGANAAQVGEEENLKNQQNARAAYLSAIGMNQTADLKNSEMNTTASNRDDVRQGAFINGLAGAGQTAINYFGKKDGAATPSAASDSPFDTSSANNQQLINSQTEAQRITNAYGVNSDASSTVPTDSIQAPNGFNMGWAQQPKSTSDERAKTKIRKITDSAYHKEMKDELTVVSDERQKDLIQSESLPQNGNMQAQNQTAMQPQGAPQTPMMAAQTAPTSMQAPQAAPPTSPAPVPASQTALGQANASLSKGGRIDDLALKDSSQLVKPQDGPDAATLLNFSMEAQRQQSRDTFGNVTNSDKDIYNRFMNEWQQNNQAAKAKYLKDSDDMKIANAGINNERSARLAKFYTGTTAVNANDIAQRYAPKAISGPATDWQSAQDAQRAQGIGDQSRGTGHFLQQTLRNNAPLIGIASGVPNGATAAAVSDENAKQDVKSESKVGGDSMNPKNFLDKLNAYSYEYKQGQKNNPAAGEGRYLSPMAQELEAAGPVGKSMVKQDENGIKTVDYGKGFGAILAAQITLNERLSAIEAKKGKGK